MHLRRWMVLPLAIPIALIVLWAFPLASDASVGVGVQAGPVRLAGVAHPGGSYALPPVYVVNTGTQAESISLRVERLSRGQGRAVPSSWVHATGPAVRLAAHDGARIPLQLDVPGGARLGRYLSDVVVAGSAAISVGRANLGVGAATKLEFSVRPGPAGGPWPALPVGAWWTLGGLLLLAAAAFGIRRSGLRIRLERRPPPGAQATGTGEARRRGGWAALALLAVSGLVACGSVGASSPAAGEGVSIAVSLKVVPTVRSVTVSPSTAKFGDCLYGSVPQYTHSTATALGYPNGQCSLGQPPTNSSAGIFPITITNTGISSYIDVSGSNAVPSDNGSQWSLCNTGSNAAVTCSTDSGKNPGMNQYLLQNFAANGTWNHAGLTNTPVCDAGFGSPGHCWTLHGQFQNEGASLIGPSWSDDASTAWTVTITWTPVPA